MWARMPAFAALVLVVACKHEPAPTTASAEPKAKTAVEAYRESAAGPGRESLAGTCTAALDAVKKIARNWGCEM